MIWAEHLSLPIENVDEYLLSSQPSVRAVREIRQFRGQRQEALAEQPGITPRYVAGIERNLALDSIEALAAQFGSAQRRCSCEPSELAQRPLPMAAESHLFPRCASRKNAIAPPRKPDGDLPRHPVRGRTD